LGRWGPFCTRSGRSASRRRSSAGDGHVGGQVGQVGRRRGHVAVRGGRRPASRFAAAGGGNAARFAAAGGGNAARFAAARSRFAAAGGGNAARFAAARGPRRPAARVAQTPSR